MTELIVDISEQRLFLEFKRLAAESFIAVETRITLAPCDKRDVYRIQLQDMEGAVLKEMYLAKILFRTITQLDEQWNPSDANQLLNILNTAASALKEVLTKKELAA